MIEIKIRLFNSLAKYGIDSVPIPLSGTVADALRELPIPKDEIYLVLLNGHNITESLGGKIETHHELKQGDTLALSGPVPFSRSYGAPVV